MSNTKHTPGPFGTRAAIRGRVTRVIHLVSGRELARVSGDEHEGNAMLFAAAPELLQAVSNCLDVLDRCAMLADDHESKEILRDAIRKATGAT